MSLTVSSFFHYFMFNPRELPEAQSRTVALISSLAIGIFTLGLTHLFCYIAFYQHRFTPLKTGSASSVDRKVRDVVIPEISVSGEEQLDLKRKKRKTQKGIKYFSLEMLPQTVKYAGQGSIRFEQMKKEALDGNVDYQLHIGRLFLLGKSGFPRSNSNAFYWYNKAANNHAPLGLYRAGKMYYKGYGVKKNKEKGLELLREAEKAGHRSAGSYLRKIEKNGNCRESDQYF